MNSSAEKDTQTFEMPTAAQGPARVALLTVDLAGLTHQGNVRPRNEDHFLITRFGRFLETVDTNLPPQDIEPRYHEVGYAMAAADGLGGHAAGQHASRLAIKYLMNLVLATPDWILRLDDDTDAERIVHRTMERFEQTSQAMTHAADLKPSLQGFGTTLTLAAVLRNELFVFNVGDSRAYLLRQYHLEQLTRDHTRAQELFDAGLIDREDLATHQWRNYLTRLLGDKVSNVQPDVQRQRVESGDCLLLCTDGLTEMVDDPKIAEILQSASSASVACQVLVEHALAAGGKDNVTVIVARFAAADSTA